MSGARGTGGSGGPGRGPGREAAAVPVPDGYRVGRWQVGELLASGAFASVYAAHRTDDGSGPDGLPAQAALKFLPTGTSTPRQLRHLKELAERELELHRRLRRPRLNTLYEALTVDDPGRPDLDGATVLVLERATGSLDRLLDEHAPGPLPDGPAILAQICEGLAQLHDAGWVHGDLKPGNVLLMPDGSVRLGDFNLAAELEGTHAYTPAFSTPDYTPPEVLWSEIGERGQQLRPTADVWAFGVLAHLVLTGSFPLPGASTAARRDAAVRYARGQEGLRLAPELPAAWREIITDCLAPSHQERARHPARDLRRRAEAAAGSAPAARWFSVRRPRSPRLWARHPVFCAAGVAAALSAVAAVTLTVLLSEQTPSYGYQRCPVGTVCFFSEPDGNGKMCSWAGDDTDWQSGAETCPWARTRPVRSIFNNDRESKERHDVEYHWRAGYKPLKDGRIRIGCTAVNAQGNLAGTYAPQAHRWIKHC
ncbi:serine/threonine-protein kinase [Streptomyces sp. NPDC058045]|uniref:serine/threonine-protein kinase n=1 Tax=Streptomyces sp. NPDC058045 TaxID=3346311 RepID=UPI0036E8441E